MQNNKSIKADRQHTKCIIAEHKSLETAPKMNMGPLEPVQVRAMF